MDSGRDKTTPVGANVLVHVLGKWISLILCNPRNVKQSGKIISFRISGLLKLTFKGLYSKK